MSQAHHPDAVEENLETHPVKLAIWVVIGAVVPHRGHHPARAVRDRRLRQPLAGGRSRDVARRPLAKRIAPGGASCSSRARRAGAPAARPAAAGATERSPWSTAAAPRDGRASPTASTSSTPCAAPATRPASAGAPKFGDKAAWAPRIKTGMRRAATRARSRARARCRPRAAIPRSRDADVKAAVDYMVAGSK